MLLKNVRLWAFSDPLGSVALARHAKHSVDSRALFSRPARRMKAQRRTNNTNGMSKVRAGSRNEEASCKLTLSLLSNTHHHQKESGQALPSSPRKVILPQLMMSSFGRTPGCLSVITRTSLVMVSIYQACRRPHQASKLWVYNRLRSCWRYQWVTRLCTLSCDWLRCATITLKTAALAGDWSTHKHYRFLQCTSFKVRLNNFMYAEMDTACSELLPHP